MPDISKFQIEGNRVDVKDSTARESIGNLDDLSTTEKASLVGSINELYEDMTEAEFMTASYDSSTETISFTLGG